MKKILKVPIIFFLSVFLLSGLSMATTYTIDDLYKEFPGSWGTGLEGSDHNGVPYIDSASITVDGGFIKQIQIIQSWIIHFLLIYKNSPEEI